MAYVARYSRNKKKTGRVKLAAIKPQNISLGYNKKRINY